MEESYQQNSETKRFLDHLSINAPLDQSNIRKLPAVYRTAIAWNQIGLLSGRLVNYAQISFANKHICRIVIPLSFRHKVSNLIHASPVAGNIGEHNTLYRICLRLFGLECVLVLNNGSRNTLFVLLRAVGEGMVKS